MPRPRKRPCINSWFEEDILCVSSSMNNSFGRQPRKNQRRRPKSTQLNSRPILSIPKSSPSKKNSNASIIFLEDSDDDSLQLLQSHSNVMRENISGKVDNFFKSGGLISDDEDEIDRKDKLETATLDIDQPSTSKSTIVNIKSNETVVIGDDTNELNTLPDIENYCKETEDYLRNAYALFEKFTETTQKQEPVSEVENVKIDNKVERGLGSCPVCLDDLIEKQVMSTKCGHLFCKDCLQLIISHKKKCPTCRKPVTKNNVIPIYI